MCVYTTRCGEGMKNEGVGKKRGVSGWVRARWKKRGCARGGLRGQKSGENGGGKGWRQRAKHHEKRAANGKSAKTSLPPPHRDACVRAASLSRAPCPQSPRFQSMGRGGREGGEGGHRVKKRKARALKQKSVGQGWKRGGPQGECERQQSGKTTQQKGGVSKRRPKKALGGTWVAAKNRAVHTPSSRSSSKTKKNNEKGVVCSKKQKKKSVFLFFLFSSLITPATPPPRPSHTRRPAGR